MKKISKLLVLVCCTLFMAIVANSKVYAQNYNRPYVEIESYSVENDAIVPGEEFEIKLKLKNTSSSNDVVSVLLTYESVDDEIEAVYGESNQKYINKIKAGESEEVKLKLKAKAGIESLTSQLVFSILYSDERRTDNNNTIKLYLPVSTSGSLQIENISVPNIVTLGTKSRISITYANYGVEELSNIVLHIVGNKLNSELEYPLESLTGGSKKYTEAYIDYQKIGNQNIQISFTYDDAEGLRHETELQSFDVNVSDNGEGGLSISNPNNGSNMNNYIIQGAVIIVVVVILIILIIIYRRKSRK